MTPSASGFRLRMASLGDADAFVEQRLALLAHEHEQRLAFLAQQPEQRLALLAEREQSVAPPASSGEPAVGADLGRLRSETRTAFVEGLESGDAVTWLAVDDAGDVHGSAVLLVVRRFPSLQNPSRREGYLAHLFVAPRARRRGIGSALLAAAIDEARRRALVRVRLHSTAEGRELYDRFGFRMRTNDLKLYLDRA